MHSKENSLGNTGVEGDRGRGLGSLSHARDRMEVMLSFQTTSSLRIGGGKPC